MFAIIETLNLLWSQSPWPWLGVLVFAGIGYWYGYVSWFVSKRRLRVLLSERKRLESSIATMRKELGSQSEVILTGERQDDPDYDDFTVLPGIDTFACARLHQKGIQYFDQLGELEELSPEELEKFRLSFGIGKFRLEEWRWSWDEDSESPVDPSTQPVLPEGDHLSVVPALGPTFTMPPEQKDTLTLMKGVGSKVEKRLQEQGIFRFAQIAQWVPSDFEEIEKSLALPHGAISHSKWIEEATLLGSWAAGLRGESFIAPGSLDYPAVLGSHFSGEVGTRIDPQFGIVYDFEPEIADELTKVPQLDSEVEAQLREIGIYRFRQLSFWTTPVLTAIAEQIGITVETIETQKWVAHAGTLDRQKYQASPLWDSNRPSIEEIQAVISSEFGEERDLEAHEDFGIVYKDQPDHADDLEELGGLNRSQAFTLNAAGVWCYRQIAAWSETNIDTFTELLGLPPEVPYHEQWLQKSAELECASSDEDIDSDFAASSQDLLRQGAELNETLGLVFSREPSRVDDLQKIRGVGPKLEERLKACGIYQFRQIALWTPDIAREFAERLPGVKERWRSDRWKEQAQSLHEKTVLSPLTSSDRSYEESESDVPLKAEL